MLQLQQEQGTSGSTNLGSDLFPLLFSHIVTEVISEMKNADGVIVVISIGVLVGSFLLNTSRYLPAIELCEECLFILKDRTAIIDKKFTKSFYKRIYFTMWKACSLISDNTNAIKYAEKLLQIYHENGERLEKCELSLKLAVMYFHQGKYPEAIQLSEKALLISRETGNRKREASCHLPCSRVSISWRI